MQKEPKFKLIIGLGNPGIKYRLTYHNLGMIFVDRLARQTPSETKLERQRYFTFLRLKESPVIANPKIFMNQSGLAVKSALNFFKIPAEKLLIVQDDIDLKVGQFKLSFGRGSAGHLGIESIIKELKTKGFWRLRLGILSPPKKNRAAEKMVLKKISRPDWKILDPLFGYLTEKFRTNENPSGPFFISDKGN